FTFCDFSILFYCKTMNLMYRHLSRLFVLPKTLLRTSETLKPMNACSLQNLQPSFTSVISRNFSAIRKNPSTPELNGQPKLINTGVQQGSLGLAINGFNTNLLQPNFGILSQFVRGTKRFNYRPSVIKRKNKHGYKTRIKTRGGIKLLWRRQQKGCWVLHT
ncbi:unnamed protein product, partial [Owenia fusiformis]